MPKIGPVHQLAFRKYVVHIHHIGKGHKRPAVTIYRQWHGVRLQASYRKPSKAMLQRLLRTLLLGYRQRHATCTPGYPITSWEYVHHNRGALHETPH